MIDTPRIAELPSAPAHVGDWEDLLVRFEIMPRALRVTLEQHGSRADLQSLREVVDRERAAAGWLRRAAGIDAAEETEVPPTDAGWESLFHSFASLRARNFAMLQRRGLEVWAWTAEAGTGMPVTAYQYVTALVRADAATLAALRGATRPGWDPC